MAKKKQVTIDNEKTAQKIQAEKLKNLNAIADAINKKAGKIVIGKASDKEMIDKLTVEVIPTASMRVNKAIGGGWPKGHFSILTGGPDSGKTFLLLETIAKNMEEDPNFTACWIESEGSLNNEPLDMFGIDRDRFYFYPVGSEGGETAMDYAITFAKQGVDMIVINSLKCLTPSKEFKDKMEDQNVALQARLNAKFMRIVIPTIYESNTALVVVQHKSTDIGSYMGGKTITGGEQIKYNSYLTVDNTRVNINSSNPLYSMKDRYMQFRSKVLKNHMRTTINPFVQCEYTVKIGKGTDIIGEIVDAAIEQDILSKKGAWIREYEESGEERILPDETKCAWNGMAKLLDFLNNNPDYVSYLKDRVEGNIETESLSVEEIDILQQQDNAEEQLVEQLNETLDEAMAEETEE